jgi:hypothetical protein
MKVTIKETVKRNPIAMALRSPACAAKVVTSKKAYNRKKLSHVSRKELADR